MQKFFWLVFFITFQAKAIIGGSKQNVHSSVFVHENTCSGVMISENTILTAGHCIVKNLKSGFLIKPGMEININAFEGNSYNIGLQYFRSKVLSASAHPTWLSALERFNNNADAAADDENTFDIGLITLSQSIPITIARLPLVENKVEIGLISGSGCSYRGGSPTFFSKSGLVKIENFTNTKFILDTSDLVAKNQIGLCKGDSGGGLFSADSSKSTMTVLGINSTIIGEPVAINPGIAVDLRNAELQVWIVSLFQKVDTFASDLQPQNIDEELLPFVGMGTNIPGPLFKKFMAISLKDDRLKCKSDLDDFGNYSSIELKTFVHSLLSPENKNKKSSEILIHLIEGKSIQPCTN